MTDQLELILEARGMGMRIPMPARPTPDVATYRPPTARTTDPNTAHVAAHEVAPGNGALIQAIHAYLRAHGPATAWQIADAVAGDRWQHATVRTACAPERSGCVELDGGVRVVRGKPRNVKRYALKEST